MKASDLREVLFFYVSELVQLCTGEVVGDKLSHVYECRAAIRRLTPVYDSDGVYAREMYKGHSVVFIVRHNSVINDTLKLRHNGKMYEIILIEKRLQDNTMHIHARKWNE